MKTVFVLIFCFTFSFPSIAQQWKPTPNDTLTSVRIAGKNQLQFSIYAPNAKEVKLGGPDLPGIGPGLSMAKSKSGVWTVVVSDLPAGAFRYVFSVDGLTVADSKNPATSESNGNFWSLAYLPGNPVQDMQNVPHGSVSEVQYFAEKLGKFRRMHVYLPPGYENNNEKYPVFYLLHGAGDCDDSWTTVGRAGIILDNLIAEKKAKPMIVVMPAGHTGPFRWGNPINREVDEFYHDFTGEIMPYVESHYRIKEGSENHAIAGLSMGGGQTLTIMANHLDKFSAYGVFSSGIFGIAGGMGAPPSTAYEDKYKDNLSNENLRKNLKVIWFATGTEDFLLETSRQSVSMLNKYGLPVVYNETSGGHTWLNWRDYLIEFLPKLFGE